MQTRSDTQNYTVEWLRDAVRYGRFADEPKLLQLWMLKEQELTSSCHCRGTNWKCCADELTVLLDTICDDLVPTRWRTQCVEAINLPLYRLQRLVQTDAEYEALRHYFRKVKSLTDFHRDTAVN